MPKITINNTVKDRIPLNEYYLEDCEHKGLVFVQHGYQSNKDYGADYLALHLARKGYFVVSVDAYKHGERIEEPYISDTEKERLLEAFNVVKKTAIDIIKIHKHHYNQYEMYDFIGVSMGGMIAYYLATKTDKIEKLVPVISTPNFINLAHYAVENAGFDKKEFFSNEKQEFLDSINPTYRLDKMKYKELHIIVGTNDKVVPCKDSLAFYEDYKSFSMSLYKYDVGHSVERDMQQQIFSIIEK